VTSGTAELEGLHMLITEERHLLVPICNTLVPVGLWKSKGLFVDIKVLPGSKPLRLPAV